MLPSHGATTTGSGLVVGGGDDVGMSPWRVPPPRFLRWSARCR